MRTLRPLPGILLLAITALLGFVPAKVHRSIEPVSLNHGPHSLANDYLIAQSDGRHRILTMPMTVRAGKGAYLCLNADAREGQIRVQFRDLDGGVLPGFSFEDCVPITRTGTRLPVGWYRIVKADPDNVMAKAAPNLSPVNDQTIQIEFEITNARIFGFELQPGEEPVLRLGDGPHLFVDDYLVDSSQGLKSRTEVPERLPEPIIGERQHPDPRVSPGTLLYSPSARVFRLWYWSPGPRAQEMRYLESGDPLQWKGVGKVVLEFKGDAGGMVIEPDTMHSDLDRKFKLMHFSDLPVMGASVLFSPDGKTWTAYDGNPVLPYYTFKHPRWLLSVSDILDPFWDPIRRRYGLFVKLYSDGDREFGVNSRTSEPGMGIRLTGMSTSADFLHWSQPWRAFEPDSRDEGSLEFYGGFVIARGDLLISFLRILRDDQGAEGQGYTVLATSRDGRTWTRRREPFLDRSKSGGFDSAFAWIKAGTEANEKMYFICAGHNLGHKTGKRQVGLAWVGRDRYLARVNESGKSGVLRTPLIRYTGGVPAGLWINADVSKGRLAVRVLTEHDEPVPGIGLVDVKGNGVSVRVLAVDAAPKLAGRTFRLEFTLDDAALYGFSFVE